jgi:hypothetical protein
MLIVREKYIMRLSWKYLLPRVFILLIAVSSVTLFSYPYLWHRFYIQRALNNIPTPSNTKQIGQQYRINTECAVSQVRGVYVTDLSSDDLIGFYNTYVDGNSAWRKSSKSKEHWTSFGTFRDNNPPEQELLFSVNLIQASSSISDPKEQDAIHEALADGKTVYSIIIRYQDNVNTFRKSECFHD